MRREANFQTLFRHWLRANPMQSAAFELKQTTKDSLPFDAVEPHQVDALMAVSMGPILYKAPDDSRGIKPFDFFYLNSVFAFVVIRYPEFFCMIDIEAFIAERSESARKSLTSARALEIAWKIIELKKGA